MSNGRTKWTPQEEILYKQGILKYGINWQLVKEHMKNQRSIEALIKRWHLKTKYEDTFQKIRQANYGRMKVKAKSQSSEEEAVEESLSGKEVVWQRSWSDQDDKKVKLLVVESGILDWDELAKHLETTADEIKLRWRKVIFPTQIKNPGEQKYVPKWSLLEDKILSIGQKKQIDWEDDSRFFLPIRTFGSIKARWRRIKQHYLIKETTRSKYSLLRQCLRNIARRQRLAQYNKPIGESQERIK